ncbi:MAG: hypothetical protein GDA51_06680 [Ekhidna sp.]|nr:hypothetical protein [Ekhidna sp.]MBC6426143.1 hypothetical protein [Ekhidna sp.]
MNHDLETLGFEQIFTNEFGSGYIHEKGKTIMLKAESDFIPIKNFRQLFTMLADEVEENNGKYTKFIFDKSTLRTFHQPSMKWYFTEWKTKMLAFGLSKHFKILPDMDYFKKAVEAARKPLLAKYPKDVLAELRIEYYDSIESALKAT